MQDEIAEDFKYLVKDWEILLELKLEENNILAMSDDVLEVKSEIENMEVISHE